MTLLVCGGAGNLHASGLAQSPCAAAAAAEEVLSLPAQPVSGNRPRKSLADSALFCAFFFFNLGLKQLQVK